MSGVPVPFIYFRATLGVKEVLQSSKNLTSIFFMIFGSTSLPQSKNVFQKKCLYVCVCVCVCVCLSVRRRSQSLNQSTDLVQIRYLESSYKYLEPFFSIAPTPKIKGSSHEKKIKNFDFLKNGSNGFYYILRIYSTFEAQQYHTIGFSRKKKSLKLEKQFLIFCLSRNVAPKPTDQSCSNSISGYLKSTANRNTSLSNLDIEH